MAQTGLTNSSINSSDDRSNIRSINKRPPEQVMRLSRMGSFHQSRLSFMRVLLRRLKRENWQFTRPRFEIDKNGVGHATYQASGPERTYTLVAFAHDLPDHLRSDRVIAEAWDATFTLFDGVPNDADIERLSKNVPYQEAGRVSKTELTLARANRSVRLFAHVVDALSNGIQPDPELIESVGYLMRTTAVYGSGKFGAADRSAWCEREEFKTSFQPEMLTVWLIRTFTTDIVEHLAASKSTKAVRLSPEIRRRFGVGNSTGLGMAPFLVNHPKLLHKWIDARETALLRVRRLQDASVVDWQEFRNLVERSLLNARQWHSDHPLQQQKIAELTSDIAKVQAHLNSEPSPCEYPWNSLYIWFEKHLGLEAQEALVSLMLELHEDQVDDLAATMVADEASLHKTNGTQRVSELRDCLSEHYGWLKEVDFSKNRSNARVWYTSIEKLEPRLGERFEEPLDEYEQPLAPARDIAAAAIDLAEFKDDSLVAEFLIKFPQHRHAVRRIQLVSQYQYGEIRNNTIDAEMMPIDMLRCKLSFFGATRFDPRSDRWVRINMFQNAPYPDELASVDPDDLAYPSLSQ